MIFLKPRVLPWAEPPFYRHGCTKLRPPPLLYIDVNKDALADAALATAKKLGASYADIRINRYRVEAVNTRERQVLNVSSGQNFGFGVRVLINGTWGFAAQSDRHDR